MRTSVLQTAVRHALASPDEIHEAQSLLSANGLLGPEKRIAYLGLLDPSRGQEAEDRRFRAFIHDVSGAAPTDAVVSVSTGTLISALELDTTVTGELPVLEEEFEIVEQLRREFTMQLDHAKAEIAAAIRQEVAASLKRSTDRRQTAEVRGAALH